MQQPINRILIGFIAFCATLGAALGVFLYISLLPHITLIGWLVAALVVLGLGCTGTLMVNFTLHKVGAWRIHRNVVAVGEVVAVRNEDGTWTHLSAQHVAAGVPPLQLPAPKDEGPLPSEAYVILDMHRQGIGYKKIAEATRWTEYKVRQLCNQFDGKP